MIASDFEVVDIASGTGKSSVLMLPHVKKVYGVEPNDEMRGIAETYLSDNEKFVSIKGTAENTTLPVNIADMIVVGHAFHWFDPEKTKEEFKRIAKQNAPTMLVWNKRHHEASNFMRAYNDFIETYSHKNWPDYYKFWDTKVFDNFFEGSWDLATFKNEQYLDWDGLRGYYLSASYAFDDEHPLHKTALDELKLIFNKFEYNGVVIMAYKTEVILGQVNKKQIPLWKKTIYHLLRIPAFFIYGFLRTGLFFKSLFKKLGTKLR